MKSPAQVCTLYVSAQGVVMIDLRIYTWVVYLVYSPFFPIVDVNNIVYWLSLLL